MSFYAIVWCPDCNGVDFEGCFDGGVEEFGPFDTHEEADKEGARMAVSIWIYRVEERE
jgi:hypothetical protein